MILSPSETGLWCIEETFVPGMQTVNPVVADPHVAGSADSASNARQTRQKTMTDA
jgi:hypothetical protein